MGSRPVELVAVERHARLEPERVTRTQAAGDDVGRLAGLRERVPDSGPRSQSTKISKPSSPV